MRYFVLVVVTILASCETTRGTGHDAPQVSAPVYSMIPPSVDDTLFLDDTTTELQPNPNAPVFPPSTFEGCNSNNSADYQPGFLLDEHTYTKENILNQAELKKKRVQVKVLKDLRNKEHQLITQAERAYQSHIQQQDARIRYLEHEAKPNWWERIDFSVGLISGISLTILVIVAVNTAQYGSLSLFAPEENN